jgi:DNA-binding NtrC family response regulator
LTEILFIGREDNAEALVQAALAPDSHALHRAHTVADASNLLSEQRFDVLIIDFDDASQGPGFDLAQLLGQFLFLPTIALSETFAPEVPCNWFSSVPRTVW